MKKALITLTVLFSLILTIIVGVNLWQGKNIESILMGVIKTPEEIELQRNDNHNQLVNSVNEYMSVPVRELTEEENQQIEKGEVTMAEVYQKIFEERVEEQSQTEEGKTTVNPTEKPSEKKMSAEKPTAEDKDLIISKYMAELYQLQNEYTAKAESTISEGASYYESLKKEKGAASARASTITQFTPVVRSLESECDAKVETAIKNLSSELTKIGADASIVSAIRESYALEKQLKLSYYSNKYLN